MYKCYFAANYVLLLPKRIRLQEILEPRNTCQMLEQLSQ